MALCLPGGQPFILCPPLGSQGLMQLVPVIQFQQSMVAKATTKNITQTRPKQLHVQCKATTSKFSNYTCNTEGQATMRCDPHAPYPITVCKNMQSSTPTRPWHTTCPPHTTPKTSDHLHHAAKIILFQLKILTSPSFHLKHVLFLELPHTAIPPPHFCPNHMRPHMLVNSCTCHQQFYKNQQTGKCTHSALQLPRQKGISKSISDHCQINTTKVESNPIWQVILHLGTFYIRGKTSGHLGWHLPQVFVQHW